MAKISKNFRIDEYVLESLKEIQQHYNVNASEALKIAIQSTAYRVKQEGK